MMLAIGFPLFADVSGAIAIIVFLLTGMSWLFNQLSAKAQQQQPPVPRPGRPVRPRQDRVQEEIDVFLRDMNAARARQKSVAAQAEAATRRRSQSENASVSAPPPAPPSNTKRRVPGEEIAARRPPVDRNLGQGVRSSVAELLGGERNLQSKVQEDLKPRVGESVASHLGTFTATAKPVEAPAKAKRSAAQNLRAIFRNPENVRRAVLINAVLSRPKGLGD